VVKQGDNIRFMVEGRPATVYELRKGMVVSAEKIVEEPDVEITTDTAVVGNALAPAPVAPAPPSKPAPPAVPQAVAPGPAALAAPQPAVPETGGTAVSPLVWLGLIALLGIIVWIVVAARKKSEKQ